jgi:exopolyphosphatase / guanosine-5'-triphosphate,3'-diphosphate pyrophosphatase
VDGVAGDLGGGSLELIDIKGDALKDAVTLPLGGLRLIDTTENRLDKALEFTDAQLSRLHWQGRGRGRTFYAVGGSWRSLAKLHMEMIDYPLRVMHGYALPTREAIEFCEAIRKGRKVHGLEGVSKARRETLPYGALVMERVLKRLEPDKVMFSVFGIREGLLFSYLSAHEQAKDPLISFCEDYSRLRSRSGQHARELCNWTDSLFDVPDSPKETPEDRRLRHAACLLSDIGWRAHPDYRGEQSLNVIAHAALTGVDHPGRLFLALAIYFRHVGTNEQAVEELSSRLKKLVDRRTLKRARIVGAAIRTAHMISIGMAGIIDETQLIHERGRIVLLLPQVHASMNGERLARRLDQLGQLVERPTEIRLKP